jgi:hypothetical protein
VGEDDAQQLLNVHMAGNVAQRTRRQPQFLGGQGYHTLCLNPITIQPSNPYTHARKPEPCARGPRQKPGASSYTTRLALLLSLNTPVLDG